MTYKIKHKLGYLGDYGHEYWTDSDWNKWNNYVNELKKEGKFGEEVEYEVTIAYNPMYDDVRLLSPIDSFKLEFLDLS